MNTDVRDELVDAINQADQADDVMVGFAFRQLAKDLEAARKPLTLSYADLGTFDLALDGMETYTMEAANTHDKEWPDASAEVVFRLKKALSDALQSGVLITQNSARGRIAG